MRECQLICLHRKEVHEVGNGGGGVGFCVFEEGEDLVRFSAWDVGAEVAMHGAL